MNPSLIIRKSIIGINLSGKFLIKRIENFIFPPLCIICNEKRIPGNNWFCKKCYEQLIQNHQKRNGCPKCSQNNDLRACACDLAWDYPFERIFSFLDYDDTLQAIMRHVKYYGKKYLAYDLGAMFSSFIPLAFLMEADIIIPVPLHWIRRRKRGYNQAEWFARGIASGKKEIHLLSDIIIRKKHTHTQVKLDKAERQTNVKGAFAVVKGREEEVRGKSVILIDDVITTGATTAACAEALLEAGVERVRVVSLGRD